MPCLPCLRHVPRGRNVVKGAQRCGLPETDQSARQSASCAQRQAGASWNAGARVRRRLASRSGKRDQRQDTNCGTADEETRGLRQTSTNCGTSDRETRGLRQTSTNCGTSDRETRGKRQTRINCGTSDRETRGQRQTRINCGTSDRETRGLRQTRINCGTSDRETGRPAPPVFTVLVDDPHNVSQFTAMSFCLSDI